MQGSSEAIFEDAGAPRSPWWSLSKTALATAALALVQRGELELDSPLAAGHSKCLLLDVRLEANLRFHSCIMGTGNVTPRVEPPIRS